MRRAILMAMAGVCATALVAADEPAQQPLPAAAPPAAGPDATGYGVGFVLGRQVREGTQRDGVMVDPVLVAKGFAEGLRGATPSVAREDFERVLAAVHQEMQARMIKRLMDQSPEYKKAYEQNLRLSQRFHELFGKQKDVVTLPSGLQYKVLRAGDGTPVGNARTVVVNAQVKLLDGTLVFEGKGVEVNIDEVTPGAAEALRGMRVGDRWQVVIPPELAHGAAGHAPNIGPNETLSAFVDLLAVKEGP